MEQWRDQGIVLSARPHGENGAIISLLTEEHGRHAGYIRGIHSSKIRGVVECGNLVEVNWQARVSDSLGSFSLELVHSVAPRFMDDPLRLGALQSACALCDAALPERELHPGIFYGLQALTDTLGGEVWGAAYVLWEIALLRELGFSLDFSRCAGGGPKETLAYVSPKTGRAVSLEAGEPYKDKLLPLPCFLKPQGGAGDAQDVVMGLALTGYFLEHWAFIHHNGGLPDARQRFELRFTRHLCKNEGSDGVSPRTAEKEKVLAYDAG